MNAHCEKFGNYRKMREGENKNNVEFQHGGLAPGWVEGLWQGRCGQLLHRRPTPQTLRAGAHGVLGLWGGTGSLSGAEQRGVFFLLLPTSWVVAHLSR